MSAKESLRQTYQYVINGKQYYQKARAIASHVLTQLGSKHSKINIKRIMKTTKYYSLYRQMIRLASSILYNQLHIKPSKDSMEGDESWIVPLQTAQIESLEAEDPYEPISDCGPKILQTVMFLAHTNAKYVIYNISSNIGAQVTIPDIIKEIRYAEDKKLPDDKLADKVPGTNTMSMDKTQDLEDLNSNTLVFGMTDASLGSLQCKRILNNK